MSSQPEKWISIERDVVDSTEWTLNPFPGDEPEPTPQRPEPVQQAAAAPAEAPTKPVRAPPPRRTPPPRRREPRRRRRWRPAVVASTAVLLLAGALGAGVSIVLKNDSNADEAADARGRDEEATPGASGNAVVVADPGGERHTCTVVGTDADDVLEGTRLEDVLCGLRGDDVIVGAAGDDVALGGSGADEITGGPGADRLFGGPGKDTFPARDGFADEIDGGSGADQADAGRLDRSQRVESLGDPVLVAAGDIACDPRSESFEGGVGTDTRCRQAHTAALVETLEPDAVLVLGDVQYEDGRYWKYLQSYHPSWGQFKRITYPTPAGEHDRFGEGGYRRYWGRRARPEGLLWYSFDLGDWHIVSLNSNCPGIGGCDPGSPQEQWLRADLAASSKTCTLAFWHEPRYSSARAPAPKMEPIWQALYDYGAELVLSGDGHSYERFAPMNAFGGVDPARGIRQFVVGTGGRSLEPFEDPIPGSRVRNATAFGVLKLTLHPGSYDWRFVRESGRRFTDSGSADCH